MELMQSLRTSKPDAVETLLRNIIEQNVNGRNLSMNMARTLFYELQATMIKSTASDHVEPVLHAVHAGDLSKCGSIQEMSEYTIRLCHQVCRVQKGAEPSKRYRQLKEQLIEFIDANYHNHALSLHYFAVKFDVSDSYISKFFKNELHYNFYPYLNQIRIRNAKKLLIETAKTVKEISYSVGYVDDNVFRRVFKKYEFVTPCEFRLDHQKYKVEKKMLVYETDGMR